MWELWERVMTDPLSSVDRNLTGPPKIRGRPHCLPRRLTGRIVPTAWDGKSEAKHPDRLAKALGLLHALARHVAGDRGVVGLAADLVDFVDVAHMRGHYATPTGTGLNSLPSPKAPIDP
jgi:hypothetical protein